MKLGIGTYTFGWTFSEEGLSGLNELPENILIAAAERSGLKLLQIADNVPVHQFSEERLQALRKAVKNKHLELEIGARGMTDQHLKRYILLASDLNVRLLRFVVDDKQYEPDPEAIIKIIQLHDHLLKQNNMILAIENHDRLPAKTLVEIIKEINSDHVGICLDTVNSMGNGESLEYIVDAFAPYTVNLRIKDFGIERFYHKQGFTIEGRTAGTGMLNIPSLLNMVEKFGKCKTAILEQWVSPEKTILETIVKEQACAEGGIQYLKELFNSRFNSMSFMNL